MFRGEKAATATEQGYNTKLIRRRRSGKPGGIEWIGHLTRAMANKDPLISPGIRAKLETARDARLATLDAERRPHAIPIWFAGEAELVSASAEHRRAIQRLRAKYLQYDADMLADDAFVLRITPVRITA